MAHQRVPRVPAHAPARGRSIGAVGATVSATPPRRRPHTPTLNACSMAQWPRVHSAATYSDSLGPQPFFCPPPLGPLVAVSPSMRPAFTPAGCRTGAGHNPPKATCVVASRGGRTDGRTDAHGRRLLSLSVCLRSAPLFAFLFSSIQSLYS